MTSGGGPSAPRRLCTYTLGFLRQRRVRRILQLSGYRLSTGWPGPYDAVGVWGKRPVSARGRWVAARSGADLVTVEDGFLRSLQPGVTGVEPLSLVIDDLGIYYGAAHPSRLEVILQTAELNETLSHDALVRLKTARLSKYTPDVPRQVLGPEHVLIIDQTRGDASITGAGADASTFQRMLQAARVEHPDKLRIIKTHPDVIAGAKNGHFSAEDLEPGEELMSDPINPWDALDGAAAVYTVSSQMGYEGILAGIKVRTFGAAFYAGWGLSEDDVSTARRTRRLSVTELFAGCHLEYPVYYDPWHDRLCDINTVIDVLEHARSAARTDGASGEVFSGIRMWKRRNLLSFRPKLSRRPKFADPPTRAANIALSKDRRAWFWAARTDPTVLSALRTRGGAGGFVEDGFLRSVGLGAELTYPASLVFDRSGIYFDPRHPSDLEDLIADAAAGASDRARAARLRDAIIKARLTKYNVGSPAQLSGPRNGRTILVPGQVEDDQSVLRGCDDVRTNLDLLKAARAANPGAWLVYKPHPDVEAGLRVGQVPPDQATALADEIAERQSAAELLEHVDEVWTMTSLMGFEALLRRKPVTCLGTPFYAGWGLTQDLGQPVGRRTARPSLDDLVWAALIAYPSYRDPVSGLPCPPELIVERLANRVPMARAGVLSRLQGLFAAQAWLWRR